ncbi:scimp protein [Caudoviricetes sp.]|nr:scimp protein [Caudoviricetes sp.]
MWYVIGQLALLWFVLSLVVAIPLGCLLRWAREGRN